MALASGLQYIDNLALRFSLHGLEDSFAGKPTFCFSWSEPFDLDTVAGKLATNPKRSRSYPTTFTKRTPEKTERPKAEKKNLTRDKSKTQVRVHSVKEELTLPDVQTARQKPDRTSYPQYAGVPEGCKNIEEESSDEELCDLMAEQENIQFSQGLVVNKCGDSDARRLERLCDRKKQNCRKRFLEEIDSFASTEAKRSRPRLDFDKVLLSKTKYTVEEKNTSHIGTYFAPIVSSDSED